MIGRRHGEYLYSIELGSAGAGKHVWRWAVLDRDGKSVARGTSIQSAEDAEAAALSAIDRLRARDCA